MADMITVASMQRNEERYILEWFAYYLIQGVDRFVIYNHQSTDATKGIYSRLAQHYPVEIYDREGYNVHYPMLQHALTEVLPTTDWLIFADMDEFYFPVKKYTIRDVLNDYTASKLSALGIYWCAYGSSGWIDDPDFVTRDYNHRGPFDLSTNHHMKSIVRGRGLAGDIQGTNPHVFTSQFGTYDTDYNLIPPWAGHNANGKPVHDTLRINHYQCKSWSYFKNVKQARGSTADRHPDAPGAQIPDSVFKDYDYNQIVDNSMWDKYGARLQETIDMLKVKIA